MREMGNAKVSQPTVMILQFFQGYPYCTSRSAVDNGVVIGLAIHHHELMYHGLYFVAVSYSYCI